VKSVTAINVDLKCREQQRLGKTDQEESAKIKLSTSSYKNAKNQHG
jgi:hypothetical protein